MHSLHMRGIGIVMAALTVIVTLCQGSMAMMSHESEQDMPAMQTAAAATQTQTVTAVTTDSECAACAAATIHGAASTLAATAKLFDSFTPAVLLAVLVSLIGAAVPRKTHVRYLVPPPLALRRRTVSMLC